MKQDMRGVWDHSIARRQEGMRFEFEPRRPRHNFQSLTSPDPNGSGDIRY